MQLPLTNGEKSAKLGKDLQKGALFMKKTVFTGSGVALITPFKDGKVDWSNLEKLLFQCFPPYT
jgi:hypothetical protein